MSDPIQFQPRDHNHRPLPVREAFPVTFEGFEGIEFCYYRMDGCWAIAEVSTGLPIVRGMGSKPEAHSKALYVLGTHGAEKTRQTIVRQLERIAQL